MDIVTERCNSVKSDDDVVVEGKEGKLETLLLLG